MTTTRLDAWHRLGTQLPPGTYAREAMDAGGLSDWNVRKVPLFAKDDGGRRIPVDSHVAVVRDRPGSGRGVLGVTGPNYQIIQNEEHADLLNHVAEESGATFDTVGSTQDGKRVFLTMRLPDYLLVGGVDRVDHYLAAVNGHDGSMAFHFLVTPVRLSCLNMLNLAWKRNANAFKVRHTARAREAIYEQARDTLSMTFGYIEKFWEQADRLVNTPLSTERFEGIIRREFGAPDGAPIYTVTRCQNKIDKMVELFAEADTQAEIRGTAWAGLNAMTEWADHFSPIRARGGDVDAARATKAILDPEFKNRATRMMLDLVK